MGEGKWGDEGGGSEQTVGGGGFEGIGVEVGTKRHDKVLETLCHTMSWYGTSQEVGTFFANRRLQLQVRDVTVALVARVRQCVRVCCYYFTTL